MLKRLMIGAILTVTAVGCVERRITIHSDPPGALVFLNDREAGRTPLTVPFEWYGDYDVILRMEGYETLKTNQRIKTPLYQYPPLDLFFETLYPGTIYDEHFWAFALQPLELPDLDTLADRAIRMRTEARGQIPTDPPELHETVDQGE